MSLLNFLTIAFAYLAWIGRWFRNIEELIPLQSTGLLRFWDVYNQFWENPSLLLVLAAALTLLGLWLVNKRKQSFFSPYSNGI